jgi:drug/metabolite transporter (DMT)-like permease
LLAGVGVALATAIIWAFGTLILSMGLEGGIDPVLVSAVRIPLVVALSLAAAGQQRQLGSVRRLDRRTWALICAAGILGWAVGSTLYSVALQMIGPGKAALISSTAPIFGVPLSALFLKERPTRNTLIGTVITVAGIVLVV